MQTELFARELVDGTLVRQVRDLASMIVFQIGISWESVFEILAQDIDKIFQSLVEAQLNKLADQFLGKEGLFEILLRTPAPKMRGGGVLFGTPTGPIWSHLKTLYWTRFLPVGYLALFLSVMVSNFGNAWGLGASKEKQRKLGLLIGLFLIPSSWYLAVGYLKLMNLLTLGIAPDLVVLQDNTVEAFSKVITTDLAYAGLIGSTSIIAFLLALILNLLRLVTLWILVPTFPLALGFDLGEFPVLGRFSRRAYTMFVVLGAVPIPIGIGFRILSSFNNMASNGGDVFYEAIAPTVFVILVPTLAALIPVYVFMQAADYATIRGATATLSIIGKPASLAVSGGTSAGWSLLKRGVKNRSSGNDSSGGDGDSGGNGDDSGSGSDAAGSSGGSDSGRSRSGRGAGGSGGSSDPPALPTRTPSGGGPKTQRAQSTNGRDTNGTGESSAESSPPALPSVSGSSSTTANAQATKGLGGDRWWESESEGSTTETEISGRSHADQTVARSNRYSNNTGRSATGSSSDGAWREISYEEFMANTSPTQSDDIDTSKDTESSDSKPESERSDASERKPDEEGSPDSVESTTDDRRVARTSRSQREQDTQSTRRRRQARLRDRYDGTRGDSE